ncbi:MAG: bifunctional hydroxymethylpyrimidine kinase/phosphomethylpyrimidine kinase, partial [Candidatus Eremiobacteraeota bacterium]|nr:bifunctional hydroxymethylpyrimidine kinase/phosphomethylpyrimidine kinase [Candidatus Eremiobacteraeota bacterium]
ERQFAALRDARIAAYRIGALLDVATIEAVAAHVARASEPVVYDPVLFASGGGNFADDAMERAMLARLVPHVRLLTPNAAEAARLTGATVRDGVDAMEAAGRALLDAGAGAVLVKGGDRAVGAVDVLVERTETTVFESPRLPGTLRGTGCLLACAAAAELGRGEPLRRAVETARAFVRAKFATARDLAGMRVAY